MNGEPLKAGQGLFSQGAGAAAQRWSTYGRIVIAAAAGVALAWPAIRLPPIILKAATNFAGARFQLWLASGQPTGRVIDISALSFPHQEAFSLTIDYASRGAAFGAIGGLAACIALSVAMRRRGRDAGRDRRLRGSAIVDAAGARPCMKGRLDPAPLSLGSVPLPQDLESRHFAFVGSTGAGKTTALREMLDGIERRGQCAVVFDVSGEFVASYYRPERGDRILNPFDARGAVWDLFAEISHPADADRIAAQLIPKDAAGENDVWTEAARGLIANVMRLLWRDGRGDLPTLLDILLSQDRQDLKATLAGTSSARTFEEDADRATASVLFMLSRAISALQFLKLDAAGDEAFSFAGFFRSLEDRPAPKPWIFISRREDQFEAIKPLLACWLECVSSALLSLEPDPARRVWLVLDEFPDIPRVQNLPRLLPQGRKYGASVILAFQAIGQMRERYGRDGADALLGSTNTKLILQLADGDSRQWASQAAGQVEVQVRGLTESLAFEVGKGGASIGNQRLIRPAIIESEFKLPRGQGYLLLPDGLPVVRVSVDNAHVLKRVPSRHPGFVPGDIAATFWGRPHQTSPVPDLPEGGPV